ncbi:Chitin synthase D [Friedmanniomyces simplex]|uniref:chitin synthase n=1 Tax=Friedmanniomyces simplex TaxID=329884 RepID=A0A4U0XXK4_9PEZI|nr:Chitin synthase D [Friedmanniomyces simplex]
MSTTSSLQALDATHANPINKPWPLKDIVYVGIVGTVMLAALLEWILWLLAFLYGLAKAFQKADRELRWSTRILAFVNMVFFVAMRAVFLPIMVVTLPLPAQVVQYFPEELVRILQLVAFWAFASLLTVPWLFCVYQLITHNVGRTRRIKTVLDEYSAPKVVIIMPCYNEQPSVLLRTVDSIVDCDYPPSCMHIFLSFDGDKENELYLNTIEQLGVPLTLDTYPKSIDVSYRSCRVTVSRFVHGGKRHCQKKTFKLIDRIYAEYLRRNDNLFLLFIDSDCVLDKHCISNFMYEMDLKPGSKRNMLAMTGVITSTTEKNTLLTVLQDMEYIHGQLFERSVESGCGAVTCLPGALTMLRFSAFRKMARYYFADKAEQVNDLFDYGKCHLGEDRWLTHLFMIGAKERYQIQMNTGAFCKTEAVQTFKSLLKQRRRWFLGFITNEVCMLTDIRLWKRYPLLLVIRLAQNTIRTTALLFFILVISILTTSQKVANLPVGFIAVSLGLNWILMLFFGLKLGRLKVTMYPLMFVLNPFLNWLYMVYGIFTAGQRTWGGPRADAGKADEHTTPAQAIEQAKLAGDELNVVPETFRPAMEAASNRIPRQNPLLPSPDIYGRFVPAQELPSGWYRQGNDSGTLYAERAPWADDNLPYHTRYGRDSFESSRSGSSIKLPRRVESIFDDPKDAWAYRDRQSEQKPAGGAHFETQTAQYATALPYTSTAPQDNAGKEARLSTASLRSEASDSSVSLHFGIPQRAPGQARKLPNEPTTTRKPHNDPPFSSQHVPTAPATARLFSHRDPSPNPNNNKGKSPLARKSFTRLASPPPATTLPMTAADVIELERLVAARNSEEMARRGRQREVLVVGGGAGGRRGRRLSKRPRGGSGSGSRG